MKKYIIHIIMDQLSADALSCAGNSYVNTPNIDKLASRGISFERAYANHPLCVPCRQSMLTGLTSIETDKRDENGNFREWTKDELKKHSIGWILKNADYDVPYAGKWHTVDFGTPPDHGFDFISDGGYYCGRGEEVNTGCRKFFTSRDKNKPFFLTTSYIQPHGICFWGIVKVPNSWKPARKPWYDNCDPWNAQFKGDGYGLPEPDITNIEEFIETNCPALPNNFFIPENEPEVIQEKIRKDQIYDFFGNANICKNLNDEQIWRLYRWTYYRLVEQADAHVGELLDMLDEFNLTKNTVIIFTSDHGEGNACHKLQYKNYLYEESARVPFFLIDPNSNQQDIKNKTHLINNGLDILPTVCDYANIAKPVHCKGESIRQFANSANPNWRKYTVIESRYGRAVVSEKYKYTIYSESPKYPEQFFDLEKDPLEINNIADSAEYKNQICEHRNFYKQWMKELNNPPLPRH